MDIKGRLHSYETCGTVDGPGIRFVVFMQGCPLKCKYCHNPDTWDINKAKYERSVDEVIYEIKKYKNFIHPKGGVTITGGEPLVQIEFVKALLKECKKEGLHTAIDTSGYIFNDKVKELLEYVDLVLLDIKCMDEKEYLDLTSVKLDNTLKFAKYLSEIGKKIWIRHVLVPGITDRDSYLHKLGEFCKNLKTVDLVEILPFHKMGEYKWKELGMEYKLYKIDSPTTERVENAKNIMKQYGLNVR
ncbi:MAG: pyruvate formate lyase activating enzyme [Fusobacteriaceae bacterium]|nr:pyruvate formate lyase activating enzyme [Fusobacteriaceae bacterium]